MQQEAKDYVEEFKPLTPYEFVRKYWKLPFDLYPYQQEGVNDLAPLDRSALYYAPGTGKTYTSIVMGLHKLEAGMVDTVLVIVPPVLITNWSRNIAKIAGTTQAVYMGTPAKRLKIDLDVQFIIVGMQIFKRDWQHLNSKLANKRVFMIIDEAQMLKNPASDNFRKVRDFSVGQHLCLLTGTPLSVPTDAYALIKLVSPSIYTTQYMFEAIHVEERDFFKKPTKYANLDILHKNLMCNAKRVLTEDVLKDLPELTYTPIFYDLDPAHLKLYRQLADEQMVKLEGGDKIDLTSVSALFQALQQVPCNAEYFSQGSTRSTVHDLIDGVLDELAGRKLVLFTYYVRTTETLVEKLAHLNPACIYGKTRDRQAEIDKFVVDDTCKVIIMNIQAGGAGIDTLQDVCRDMLFVELPLTAAAFRQAVARLHRDGQKNAVHCRIAVAQKTVQCRIWDIVLEKDSLVNQCIRGPLGLREALHGS